MATTSSPAVDFTLSEEGGTTLTLRDRALPYRPLTITGKQRAEFTWYPGNPEATVQMLGPDEGNIQLRGYWKDRFIQGTESVTYVSSSAVRTLGLTGQIPTPDGTIDTVVDLVARVDAMRRSGRRIKLSWGNLVRVGHITGFTQTWHNVHDVEWEIDFSVVSQGEGTVPTSIPNVSTATDNYQKLRAEAQAWVAQGRQGPIPPTDRATIQVNFLNAELNPLQSFYRAYDQVEQQLFSATQASYGLASNLAQYAAAPGDVARRTAAIATGLVTQFSQFTSNVVDRALSDVISWGLYPSQDDTPLGLQMNGELWKRAFRNATQAIVYSNAITRNEAQKQLNDQLTASFIASDGMDLRDVSTRYYGVQDHWKTLMEFNGLQSSLLKAGQLVKVPRQPLTSGAGQPSSSVGN